MKEKPTQHRETFSGPAGIGSIFDEDDFGADSNQATVASGIHNEQLPVANSSVGEIRARFRDRLEIQPGSTALIDGTPAGEDTIVRQGQTLRFQHTAGEKGTQFFHLLFPSP